LFGGEARVPENLSAKYLDPAQLARLMAQPMHARSPMEGSVSGLHKSPHRGSSVEFAEYRNYVPGDDLRRLDWRVFGRTDRFYIREFEAETNLRLYVVLDCSESMAFQLAGARRFDLARRLAAAFAYMAVHQGDAAGLLCVGEKKGIDIPPRRNPAHMQLILEVLDRAEPKGTTTLAPQLHELAEKIRPRGLVVILSDFFSDPEDLINAFQHLRFKKHDLALFHLLDRSELDFKFDRPIRFLDLEGNSSIVTEPAIIRDEYLRQIERFVGRLRDGCHEVKASYHQIISDQDYEKILAEFLIERARFATAA
jgi:uncharacterized protein (DUF58 family)